MEDGALVLEVDAEPDRVMQRVAERFVTGTFGERHGTDAGRFSIVYQDRRRITVSRWTFSYPLYLFLLLFLFVPGIIYRALAQRKTLLTTVDVGSGEAPGKTRATISGNDPRAKEAVARLLKNDGTNAPA